MVIGMNDAVISLLPSQKLDRAVGDHFIGIHVKGSSRAALNRINDKMLTEITGKNLIARLYNRLGFLWIQQADLTVYNRWRFFDLDKTVNELRMQVEAGDPKVLHCPQCLHSVIGIHRHFFITDGIVFDTELFLPGFSLFGNSTYSRRPADSAPQHFSDHVLILLLIL